APAQRRVFILSLIGYHNLIAFCREREFKFLIQCERITLVEKKRPLAAMQCRIPFSRQPKRRLQRKRTRMVRLLDHWGANANTTPFGAPGEILIKRRYRTGSLLFQSEGAGDLPVPGGEQGHGSAALLGLARRFA